MARFNRLFLVLLIIPAIWSCASARPPATQPVPQPIAWQSWSDDVFVRAKREHKFVLMDLQAVWCHWCHVMDETTYRDPAVAARIAAHYIAVKVDQDSRPDLATRYEDYGWPATVVFNADGSEIVKRRGYLPPEAMASVLDAIVADPTPGPSVQPEATIHPATAAALSPEQTADLIRRNNDTYDGKMGGWGFGQKFLDWDSVEYSMSIADHDPRAAAMAKGTLAAQQKLIDPLWGGVDQYSTDGDWDHPHFEKIMQMQAENLRIYAYAYAKWHDPAYLAAAQNIHRFLVTFLRSPNGAFYVSQDADLIPGEHSADYFKLDDAGRRKLGVPKIDTHIYSRENGWAITGLAALHDTTGDAGPLDEAKQAAAWIIAQRSLDGGGFRHDQTDSSGPYLADTLAMGRAFLSLYASTGDRAYLARADAAAGFVASHFQTNDIPGIATWDVNLPGPFRPKAELDENVNVARFANLLWHYTGKAGHRALAEGAMKYLASPDVVGARRVLVGGILLANHELATEPLHITIAGGKDDPQAEILFAAALAYPKPYRRVEWYDPREGPLPHMNVEYPPMKKAAAFVCTGDACSSPASNATALIKAIARSGS